MLIAAMLAALSVHPAGGAPPPVFPTTDGARCTFSSAAHTLDVVIEIDPTYLNGTTSGSVALYPEDGEIVLRGGDGSHSVTCTGGTPTTTTVDTIRVTKDREVEDAEVSLGGRQERFAPGATDEGDGSSEIEVATALGARSGVIVHLSDRADRATLGGLAGAAAANLNSDEAAPDPDLVIGDSFIAVDGGRGDDIISAASSAAGFDGPLPSFGRRGSGALLFGGGGDDRLVGSPLRDSLLGDAGHDRIRAGAGSDHVLVQDSMRDAVDCGSGAGDRAEVDAADTQHACERRRVAR